MKNSDFYINSLIIVIMIFTVADDYFIVSLSSTVDYPLAVIPHAQHPSILHTSYLQFQKIVVFQA